MTLVVRTGCLKSSAARRDDALDVTRGSGHGDGLAFAPSAELFLWVKGEARLGRLERAWPEYEARYLEEVTLGHSNYAGAWGRLLARPSVTLLCYCENVLRCHRGLLAAFLVERCGATYEGEVDLD